MGLQSIWTSDDGTDEEQEEQQESVRDQAHVKRDMCTPSRRAYTQRKRALAVAGSGISIVTSVLKLLLITLVARPITQCCRPCLDLKHAIALTKRVQVVRPSSCHAAFAGSICSSSTPGVWSSSAFVKSEIATTIRSLLDSTHANYAVGYN